MLDICLYNPCPAEPGYACLCKQYRSRSVGLWRSQWFGSALFAILYLNLYQQPGSSNLIGWKLEVGPTSKFTQTELHVLMVRNMLSTKVGFQPVILGLRDKITDPDHDNVIYYCICCLWKLCSFVTFSGVCSVSLIDLLTPTQDFVILVVMQCLLSLSQEYLLQNQDRWVRILRLVLQWWANCMDKMQQKKYFLNRLLVRIVSLRKFLLTIITQIQMTDWWFPENSLWYCMHIISSGDNLK